MDRSTPLTPPATIGILGGGQLGRMLGLAARTMGYRIWAPRDVRRDCAAPGAVLSSAGAC